MEKYSIPSLQLVLRQNHIQRFFIAYICKIWVNLDFDNSVKSEAFRESVNQCLRTEYVILWEGDPFTLTVFIFFFRSWKKYIKIFRLSLEISMVVSQRKKNKANVLDIPHQRRIFCMLYMYVNLFDVQFISINSKNSMSKCWWFGPDIFEDQTNSMEYDSW